jgi:hypothetical protein
VASSTTSVSTDNDDFYHLFLFLFIKLC